MRSLDRLRRWLSAAHCLLDVAVVGSPTASSRTLATGSGLMMRTASLEGRPIHGKGELVARLRHGEMPELVPRYALGCI